MIDNKSILRQRFLEQLVRWLRQQRFKEPDFRRMASTGEVAGHSQKYAVFEFSRRHKAYMGFLKDDESKMKPERDVFRSWVTALHKSRFTKPEVIIEKCLPFMPAGERCAPIEYKGCNVVRVQMAWGTGGQYERLGFPSVRDCLFTFVRHALRYSFEILKQQETALTDLRL